MRQSHRLFSAAPGRVLWIGQRPDRAPEMLATLFKITVAPKAGRAGRKQHNATLGRHAGSQLKGVIKLISLVYPIRTGITLARPLPPVGISQSAAVVGQRNDPGQLVVFSPFEYRLPAGGSGVSAGNENDRCRRQGFKRRPG